jgi:hypothetical protein
VAETNGRVESHEDLVAALRGLAVLKDKGKVAPAF